MGLAGYSDLVRAGILQHGAAHFPHLTSFFRDTGMTMVGFAWVPQGCTAG